MNELNELATALNAFQAEVVAVHKSADNPFFKSKYAPLDAIMREALPALTKHGLAVTQLLDNIDGQSALTTTLLHKSGQSISSTMPLLMAKQDPQGQGSAITYARRYSYAAVLGIVIDEDDDGNKASAPSQNFYSEIKPAHSNTTGLATQKQREYVDDLLEQNGCSDDVEKKNKLIDLGLSVPLTFEGAQVAIEELKRTVKKTPAGVA